MSKNNPPPPALPRNSTLEKFCASDVRYNRSLADAAGDPVLSFQMAEAIQAMQPLMNMINYPRSPITL